MVWRGRAVGQARWTQPSRTACLPSRPSGTIVPVPTRILLITGDAGESYECLYARHRLLEAGLGRVVAAPSQRRLHLVIHDFEPGWDTYIERQGTAPRPT